MFRLIRSTCKIKEIKEKYEPVSNSHIISWCLLLYPRCISAFHAFKHLCILAFLCLPYHFNNPVQIAVRHLSSRRQTQPPIEKVFSDFTANNPTWILFFLFLRILHFFPAINPWNLRILCNLRNLRILCNLRIEYGLHMQGLPHRPRLDIFSLKGQAHLFFPPYSLIQHL